MKSRFPAQEGLRARISAPAEARRREPVTLWPEERREVIMWAATKEFAPVTRVFGILEGCLGAWVGSGSGSVLGMAKAEIEMEAD